MISLRIGYLHLEISYFYSFEKLDQALLLVSQQDYELLQKMETNLGKLKIKLRHDDKLALIFTIDQNSKVTFLFKNSTRSFSHSLCSPSVNSEGISNIHFDGLRFWIDVSRDSLTCLHLEEVILLVKNLN